MAIGFQLGAVAAGAGRLVSRLRRLLGGIRTAISRIPLTSASGRMTAMHTTRSPAEITSAADIFSLSDRTTWSYDQPTGLLTNKLYADGKGTAYTYTPDGRLATRAWARGVTTTYAYDAAGSLAAIAYSDDTPDVAFTYDRLGRMASATVAGVSTNLFTYDALDLVAETRNGVVITRSTDALGRPSGFSLGPDYAVEYAYDAYGRFHSVSSSVQSAQSVAAYSRLADSDLLETTTFTLGSSTFDVRRSYESARSLITAVENRHGETVISRYDYTNDEIGRRTAISRSGQAFGEMPVRDTYGYNLRSEVTSARRTPVGSQTEVRGFSYDYAYDPIGNRVTSTEYDHEGNALESEYTANALNQYERRTVPGYAGVRGTATNTATVTVNGNPAWRLDEYFYGGDSADNSLAAIMKQLAITAVYNPPGTNTPDVVTSQTGRVFVAQTPEAFTYDDDGNLTRDGRFTYAWDAENRLISATTRADLPASVPRIHVEYTYDHQFRRIASVTAVWTNNVWQAVESRACLYDGWNVVQETINHQPSTTNYYTWGLDLSGSLQGAGGIGGLLSASLDGTTAFYCYDANGNVGQLIGTDGELLAHYEYSPFGETIVSAGPLAKANPFRFSTKHWDNLTGLGYWGYRWYSPGLGRWPSRDPINDVGFRKMLPDSLGIGPLDGVSDRLFDLHGEQANVLLSEILRKLPEPKRVYLDEEANLYGFICNDLVNSLDLLGLKLCVCCFKGSKGKLFIDASCKGVLSIWIIDEGSAPAAGGTSGSWNNADGYVLGGTTYKIDGSTCVKMTCTASTLTVETCVNLIAGAIGKKPPYAVPDGTFDGPPKEPPTGSPPPVVK